MGGHLTSTPKCVVCGYQATLLVPQSTDANDMDKLTWVPVCADDAHNWLDGGDWDSAFGFKIGELVMLFEDMS